MAEAITTRNEQHASRGDPRHEKRIVICAAHHLLKWQVGLVAGMNQRVRNDRRTDGGRVGVYDLKLDGYATFLGNMLRFLLDCLQHSMKSKYSEV